ncbi:MAG: CobD/CbiB family cobalamin biosynthesis protein [Patulibacter sp.]
MAADVAFGDPRRRHPVAGFGQIAAGLEARWYAPRASRGAAAVALLVGGAVAPVAGWQRWAGSGGAVRRLAGVAGSSAIIWSCLGGRSLWAIGDELAGRLEAGDVEAARALLPSLAGRDPSQLDASGIARAATESIAENTADAVLGTLLWGACFGPAGAVAHRAANTLDAMFGHRSPRYQRFGMPAARLDDVLGVLPARLGAWLAVTLPSLRRLSSRRSGDVAPDAATPARLRWPVAARVLRRDGRRHPSPNAGPMEAAFAAALGVRLGGPLRYGERDELRPLLNAEGRAPDAAALREAVELSRAVSIAALLLVTLARLTWTGNAGHRAPAGRRVGRTRPARGVRRTRGRWR